jgi:protein-export membrane protein SecD
MLYFPRWKIAIILFVVIAGFLACIPNFFSAETVASWPSWLPKRQLVLGLDLRGGAHLLLEVDRSSLLADRLKTLEGDVRETLRKERIGYRGLGARGQAVTFTLRDTADAAKATTALQPLATPVQSGLFGQGTMSEVELSADDQRIDRQRIGHACVRPWRRACGLDRRLNALGTTEPSIQAEGSERILVEVPGLADTTQLKQILGQTARMTFHMECTEPSSDPTTPPPGCESVESATAGEPPVTVESRALLTGDDLADAQPSFHQQTGEPIVTFRFNTRGARIFADVTQQNVGRRFAVVLDDKYITAPVIRDAILGGSGLIEGNFTVESAQNLSVLLRAGALPADLTIVEERTVGPSLGQDSIRAGAIASIVALVAVVVFMVVCYGLLGLFADVAMMANGFLMIGDHADRDDADPARHCRHCVDDGRRRRRQRPDLRTNARGGAPRPFDHFGDRDGVQPSACDDRRLASDGADRCARDVCARLRSNPRLCRRLRDRHRIDALHIVSAHAADRFDLGSPGAPEGRAPLGYPLKCRFA